MIIKPFSAFKGQHCETTATGNLLKHIGVDLSEPMLFGIGQGLNFIYWDMKIMDFPFIGGRIREDALTKNIARNLNLKLEVDETSSIKKAWENVKKNIDNNIVVGIKLDCYYLDYFTNKYHFAAHYVAMYGYDDNYAYLIDTEQQGGIVKTSLKNLALARNEKGLMSSKNLSYTIRGKAICSDQIVLNAIKQNAKDYLNPPIQNMGWRGIIKFSKEIKNWFKRSKNPREDLVRCTHIMEYGGTGGALFRNLYRDFLKENLHLHENIKESYLMFCELAKQWETVSTIIGKAGTTKDEMYLNKASDILQNIADNERKAMDLLQLK